MMSSFMLIVQTPCPLQYLGQVYAKEQAFKLYVK